jgi:hypothetical protein
MWKCCQVDVKYCCPLVDKWAMSNVQPRVSVSVLGLPSPLQFSFVNIDSGRDGGSVACNGATALAMVSNVACDCCLVIVLVERDR